MSLADSVVTVNISKVTQSPTRAGFGTPLLLAYHTVTAKKVALYGSLAALVSDGFPLTHPVYRMAAKVFSQTPAPTSVVVGKRAVGTTQVIQFVPKNFVVGFVYTFSVFDYLGVETDVSYVVPGAATAASVSTAIVALLGSVASVTAVTVSTTGFSLTSTTAGRLFNLTGLPNPDDLHLANTSTDPGIAADLAAVSAVDSRSWYGILLDSNSKAEIVAAAAWAESNFRKLMVVNTSDSDCADNTITTDVMSALKASSYSRTATLFSGTELLSYSAAAWMGRLFPNNPGKAVWFFVTLASVTIDNLKDGQIANIEAKNGNVYVTLAGQGATDQGIDAEGEWLDIITGTDWLQARMQERILGAIQAASNAGSKIPYTDHGVAIIVGLVLAQLKQAITPAYQLLAATPAPTVTAPPVASVDPGDRAARNLPDITFAANYAGAIRSTTINGTISV